MKEAIIPVREAFVKGLRDQFDPQHNADRLTYASNLRPYGGGSRLQQIPSSIVHNLGSEPWPYPQMYITSTGIFVCGYNKISKFTTSFVLQTTLTVPAGGPWSIADFGKYTFLCNGVARIYIDPTTNSLVLYSGASIPIANTCCDFNRGQLILGGVQEGWYDCKENFIAWSSIGDVNCTPGSGSDAGYMPADFDGPIFCVKQLGQHIMIYGEQGICGISPANSPAVTWGMRTFDTYGIPSRTAITGDLKNHYFVDTANELWRITANMELVRMGGKSYIAQLTPPIAVTYHTRRSEVYISDTVKHFVRTKDGLGGPNQVPISGAVYVKLPYRDKGGLAIVPGVAASSSIDDAEFVTDSINFERSGIKTLQWIELQATVDGQQAMASIDYKYNIGDTWITSSWYPFNSEGTAHIPISGVEFRIRVRIPLPLKVLVDSIRIRWKSVDNRFSRGLETTAKQYIAGEDSNG